MMEYSITKTPVGEKRYSPSKSYLSQYDGNRRQVADLPVHCSREQSSPSENFGDPQRKHGEKGMKIPKITLPDKRVDIKNLETRAETAEKIMRKENLSSSRGNCQ